MNDVYKKAIEQQNNRGKAIFLTNIEIAYNRTFGTSKRIKKEFYYCKKIVASGTMNEIINSNHVKLSCLVQLFGKEKGYKSDRSRYTIESVEFLSFHGYSFDK